MIGWFLSVPATEFWEEGTINELDRGNQWRLLTDEQGVRASLYRWFERFRAKLDAIIAFSRRFSLIFARMRENPEMDFLSRQTYTKLYYTAILQKSSKFIEI